MSDSNNEPKPLVFCVGLVKTGTTSLLQALGTLGWTGCDDIPAMKASRRAHFARRVSLDSQSQHVNGSKPFDALTGKYNAFSQNPTALHYLNLSSYYPDAKFILTVRDINATIASMLIHVAWNRLHPNPEPHMDWHNLDTQEDEALYQHHPENVRRCLRNEPERLLTMDITKGDGWDKLCPFLGVPVPTCGFPHANQSKQRLADMFSGNFS